MRQETDGRLGVNGQRVSVAMCTYNGGAFLREQLDSIASQTRLPDETVVFDDRSSDADATVEILKDFAAKAPFPVRVTVNTQNIGSTKNFEQAIRACTGGIIVLSDQDDVWLPDKLARIEAVFSSSPRIGVVFTDGEVVDDALRPLGYRLWQAFGFTRKMQRRLSTGEATEVLLKYNVVTGATMAFRSEYVPLVVPFPESCVHDWWIALLVSFIADLAMIPEPLIKYRQHSANQIGGIKLDWSGKVGRARGVGEDVLREVADGYRAAYDRLCSRASSLKREELLSRLAEKVRHFEARSGLPDTVFGRLPVTIKELVSLRYHRYSLGTKSFFKDLFLHPAGPR
ncbi:MAG: glycosyltransferase family 2 protein [Deltaproteobacteria bacterium]|nr:glycosyltransferase family 2 protein [Deltaproteobacteria bacterium]